MMHRPSQIQTQIQTMSTNPRPAIRGRPRHHAASTRWIGATLLALTTTINAQPPDEPVAVVAGSSAVGADASGKEASERLFSVFERPSPDGPRGWKGNAQLGYFASSGNSETSNVNASALVAYTSFPWRHYFSAEANFGENSGASDTERWAVGYKPEFFFRPRSFAFLFLGYDHDKFADINARYSATLGIGQILWSNDNNVLIGELGVGYRQTDYISETENTGEAVGRASIGYSGRITRSTNFNQTLTTLAGSTNTFFESVTALQVSMTETLALSLNYTVQYNSFAPPGFENTDTFTSVNLVAAF
jgi:putative salt-induced outer membrane protein